MIIAAILHIKTLRFAQKPPTVSKRKHQTTASCAKNLKRGTAVQQDPGFCHVIPILDQMRFSRRDLSDISYLADISVLFISLEYFKISRLNIIKFYGELRTITLKN